ncbi:MAG: class I SAM-dependent methyltransferase [Candidatus Entotheonellia bacterium]
MGYEGRLCLCGMVYTNPKPPPGAIDYTVDHHPAEFYAYPAPFKARWMARHCPKGRLLEVGCGEGFFLAAAQALGYEVFGLEPHPERARRTREQLHIDVAQSFLESHTLPTKSFDVVYHCDLLAHFPDPLGALRTMSNLLRPGGVLCFEVGILGGVSPFWYRLTGRIGLGYHLWLYSEPAVESLLTQAGLRIGYLQRFGLAPRVIISRAKGGLRQLIGSAATARHSAAAHLHAQRTQRGFNGWLLNFLRYRVGALVPGIGPQTLLIVARPETEVGDT